MTKAEHARIVAWRLRVLGHAEEEPRCVAQTCRYFGISRTAFYRWKKRDDELGMDVKFLERIPGTAKRLSEFTAIDGCTRIRILKVYDACNQRTAIRFLNDVRIRLPFRILVL